MTPLVTVVVPTCGRPHLLQRCLAALERQSLQRDRFEIIVIDDSVTRHGPAAARNRGWWRARAPIVAFTDDDTEPDPDWLRSALNVFLNDPQVDAVCGRIVMPTPAIPTDYERDAKHLERSEFVTANCLVRRRVLQELDGFDENFRLPWREDSDLHFRLLRLGARIRHEPKAVVVHPVRAAPWGVSLLQQRKIMFDALLYKKHPQLYRERIRGRPRWDYYGIVASLLAAGAALAAGSLHAATLFALVWAALTARFLLHRLRGSALRPRHVAEMLVTSIAIPPVAVFWRAVGALRFRVAFV
jgi:GT2 family glycosyltransferase